MIVDAGEDDLLDAVHRWAATRILTEFEEDLVAAVEGLIRYETEARDADPRRAREGPSQEAA